MNRQKKLSWTLEAGWWVLSLIAGVLVLLPIVLQVPNYPFMTINFLYVLVFIQATRHIFFLRYSPLADKQILKIVLFFLCIPAIFLMVDYFNEYQYYTDDFAFEPFLSHLSLEDFNRLSYYISSEMVFFASAAIISTILFALRMIISVWRFRNRGKA